MAENNSEKSCYMELKEFYENKKGELYSLQDFNKAGQMEYKVFTEKVEPLKLFKKNKKAHELLNIIFLSLENDKDYSRIEKYINLNPIVYYYENIREMIKVVIEEKTEKKESFEHFVQDIIYNSNDIEMIKLSIIAAQVIQMEKLEEILDIFSIHNEFIFYVLNDYSHMGGFNEKIFQIVKRSKSYGKLFALAALKITSSSMEDWIIENGCIDNYGIPEITQYSMLSADLLSYVNRTKFDYCKIEVFSKSISIMLSDYGLAEVEDDIPLCKKLLGIIDDIGGGIYSLYTVVSILYSVDGIIIDYYKEKKNIETLKNYEGYKDIIELCTDICSQKYWNDIIEEAINNIDLEPDVLVNCIEKCGYKLKKKEYESILKRDYLSPLLYKYALCAGNKAVKKSAFKIGIKNLPISDMTSGADDLKIDDLTYDEISYICLYILVKYSHIEDFSDDMSEYKDMLLNSLQCPLVEIREECVNKLEKIKNTLNESEIEFIHDCIGKECSSNIKRGLKALLHKDDECMKKKIVAKNVEKLQVHPQDAFLTDLDITGDEVFDRIKVQNMIQENSFVYIVENPYEEDEEHSSVVCMENGYVIGYLEKPVDDILGNMIKSGRFIYGKIKQINDDLSSIKIAAYLSYRDVEVGVSNILELLSKVKEEYIQ